MREQHQSVGAVRGHRQVVEGNHHRQSLLHRQPLNEVFNLDSMSKVETGCRLVEEEHSRLLRQGSRDEDTLSLASRERQQRATLQRVGACRSQRLPGDGKVLPTLQVEAAEMWMATHQHQLNGRQVEVEIRVLRNSRHQAGDRGA